MTTNIQLGLQLEHLQLQRRKRPDGTGAYAFDATGRLVQGNGDLAALPAMRVGVGQIAPVSERVREAFPSVFDADRAADGLWIGTADEQAAAIWFAAFTEDGIDLYTIQPLPDVSLVLPDAHLAELSIRLALRTRGSAVERATLTLTGQLRGSSLTGPGSPLQLDGLDTTATLEATLRDVADLDNVLNEPVRLLDAAFNGHLRFKATAGRAALGSLTLEQATTELDLEVSSPRESRALHLERVNLIVKAPMVTLGDAQIEQLALAGGYTRDTEVLHLDGAGVVTLNDVVAGMFAGATASKGVQIRLALRHGPEGPTARPTTRLELDVDQFTLSPRLNLLELSARDLRLALVSSGGAWQLSFAGFGYQSWSALAARLERDWNVDVPNGMQLPDLRVKMQLELAENAQRGQLDFALDLLAPGTAARGAAAERPFSGRLGALPVLIDNASLTFSLLIQQDEPPRLEATGSAIISTIGRLRDYLPLQRVECSVQLEPVTNGRHALQFRLDNGLPTLLLPPLQPDGELLRLVRPQSLQLRIADELELAGEVDLLPDWRPETLADTLGLPEWDSLLKQIGKAVAGGELPVAGGELRVSVPLTASRANPGALRISVTLRPKSESRFGLFEVLGSIIQPTQTAPGDNVIPAPKDFLQVRSSAVRFDATIPTDGEPSLELAIGVDCNLFGEHFDATLGLSLAAGQPELFVLAGVADPVMVRIPTVDPATLLGKKVDIPALAHDFGLNSDQQAALEQIRDAIQGLAQAPGLAGVLIFELHHFGLRVRANEQPTVGGELRLVQIPGLLGDLLAKERPDLGLAATQDEISIVIETSGQEPLLSLPAGAGDRKAELFLYALSFAYGWGNNAISFGLKADVRPNPPGLLDADFGGSGVRLPGTSADIQLGKTISPDPVVIPEWQLSFYGAGGPNAADNLGLQLYVGDGECQYLMTYLRETRFSPMYSFLTPGLLLDGGIVLGGPNPETTPADVYSDLGNRKVWDRADFFAVLDCKEGLALFVNGALGVLFNPLAAVPPFITPIPPYWIAPPWYMVDLFPRQLTAAVNVPGLVYFQLTLQRPQPQLSLQAMLELGALVLSGFARPLPKTSAVRDLFYAGLAGRIELPLPAAISGGEAPRLEIPGEVEVNIVDSINGAVKLVQEARRTLEQGTDLAATLIKDPARLVAMVPIQYRRLTLDAGYTILGLSFSGSLFLLTPEELRRELVQYHEGRRVERAGLPAPLAGTQARPQVEPAPTLLANPVTPLLRAEQRISREVITNHVRPTAADPVQFLDLASAAMQEYVGAKTGEAIGKQQDGYEELNRLKQQRSAQLKLLLASLWERIRGTRLSEGGLRAPIYREYGLEPWAGKLEELIWRHGGPKIVTLPFPVEPFPPHSRQQGGVNLDPYQIFPLEQLLGARWPTLVDEFIASYEEAPGFTIFPGLARSPGQIARAIISEIVLDVLQLPPLDIGAVTRPGGIGPIMPGMRSEQRSEMRPAPSQRELSVPSTSQPGIVLPTRHGSVEPVTSNAGSTGAIPTGETNPTGPGRIYFLHVTATPSEGRAPLTVQLSVTGGPRGIYTWKLGDGRRAQGAAVTHVYSWPGTYTAEVEVQPDSGGAQLSASSKPIIVRGPSVITIVTETERQESYLRHLPAHLIEQVVGPVEVYIQEQQVLVDAGAIDTPAMAEQLRRDLQGRIAQAIFDRVDSFRDSLVTTAALDLNRETVKAQIEAQLRTSAIVAQRETKIAAYDATGAMSVIEQLSEQEPHQEAQFTQRIVGWEIRQRDSQRGEQVLGSARSEPFAVKAPGPSTPYTVRMQGALYRLVLLDDSGVELETHILPDALVASVPEGLTKAEELRARLEIAERVERRPIRAEEARGTERITEGPELYAESILARREYTLKPDGGSRGPLLLADLLCRNDGSYRVPRTPVLLAGATVEVLGSKIGMAGLLSGDGVLLHGFHTLVIPFQEYLLQLDGELSLVAGSLWDEVPAGLTRDALSFRGAVKLSRGDAILLQGEAKGLIGVKSGQPWLKLELTVDIQGGFEVTIADTAIAKLTWELTSEVQLYLRDGALNFAMAAGLELNLWRVRPAMKRVELTPETTVCVPVPATLTLPPEWRDTCATIPAVVIDVPDPTQLIWEGPTPLQAELHIALDKQFSVELRVSHDEIGLPNDLVINLARL